VQEEGRPFLGREPLEQRQERHRQIGGEVEVAIRRRRRVHDRLGQPWTDVRLALGLEPPQPIDCQPCSRRHEPPFRAVDVAVLRLVPPDIRFLHDVFGVGARAEHPVSEAEEPPAECLERGDGGPGLVHTSIL
jgi:hypothetical protein